jgi:predicted oxidoreductase
MSQQRMELWSNDILTEFAIKFNSIIVVTTSNNLDAMGKIDVCPYRPGYEFDWHYTLSQWVVYFLANKFTALLESKTSVQKEFNIRDEDDNEIYSSHNVSLVIKVKNKLPPKPGLKCHFCNLKYCLEQEREQHEEFWHSNKIKT